ncbi:hypothetical protein ACHAXS_010517, partial [Conticribra weissflogii]
MEQERTQHNDIIVIIPPSKAVLAAAASANGKNWKRKYPGYHHHNKIIAPLAFLAGVTTVVFQREVISLHSILRYCRDDDRYVANFNANAAPIKDEDNLASDNKVHYFQKRRMQSDYGHLLDINDYTVKDDDATVGNHTIDVKKSNSVENSNKQNQYYSNERKIAWLLSFPNSGTSYTTKLVRRITQTSTATNYGEESQYLHPVTGGNVPVLKWSPGGPFWSSPSSSSSVSSSSNSGRFVGYDGRSVSGGLSSPLVLTKTHCTGRCVSCTAREYLTNLTEFYGGFQTGKRYHVTDGNYSEYVVDWSSNPSAAAVIDDENTTTNHRIIKKYEKRLEVTNYNATKLVAKAIHLLRNPLDNIVARFHLARKRSRKKGESDFEEFTSKYSNDREGFREWCRHLDTKEEYLKVERELFSSDEFSHYSGFGINGVFKSENINGTHKDDYKIGEIILRAMEGIPCHADFFRYVQWHNLAFRMISEMKIPELVLRYENYESNFNFTLHSILQFLGFDMNGDDGSGGNSSIGGARHLRERAKEFVGGKSYANYFTVEEIGK